MDDLKDRAIPDAMFGNWVDRLAPFWVQPYLRLARLDRPIGWWLLVLPCWWSAALVASYQSRAFPALSDLILFFIGAVAMRGAGSTYNDIVDRDLDRRVARTRSRPVASGQVSVKAASLFCALQCLIGLLVLLSFNAFAIGLGFLSMVPVLIYPFMKRITSWPQAVLGLAFSWGALMGWATSQGALAAPAFWLYGAAVAWTMGYDTIYAVQDIEDDAIAGIRSTALLFGAQTPLAVGIFYALASLMTFAALISAGVGWVAYTGATLFSAHLFHQTRRIRLNDGALALKLFRSNRDAGLLLFAGLALDAAVRHVLPGLIG
ncbi:MAG: 4-hydroxybenzoate octaprenyltransferase [Alphaproteobacteria bacterium]|jgi:4-hydroxybenzoate polyprenyltransferase|nr:4-hydroxybenzoate octaprenyltransferase [Alphaproteobacteria bacterium]